MKQIGAGVVMYVGDYQDYLLPDGVWNKNGAAIRGRDTYWCSLIYPYATAKPQPGSNGRTAGYWYFKNGFGGDVFCCPSSTVQSSKNFVYIESGVPYGMNFVYLSLNGFVKTNKIKRPSATLFASDSTTTPGTTFTILVAANGYGNSYYPFLRHGGTYSEGAAAVFNAFTAANKGRANTVMVDGHVESLGYKEIVANNNNLFRLVKL